MKKINLFSKIMKMLQLMKIQFFILSFNHNVVSLNVLNFIMIIKLFLIIPYNFTFMKHFM